MTAFTQDAITRRRLRPSRVTLPKGEKHSSLLVVAMLILIPDATTTQSAIEPAKARVTALNFAVTYVIEVTVGTPPQSFLVNVDTGSSDFILCKNDGKPLPPDVTGARHFYDPSKSTSFSPAKDLVFKIWYGDETHLPIPPPLPNVSGPVGTDVMSIGAIAIKDQAIQYTEGFNNSIMTSLWDGILGLSFVQANTVTPTKVQNPMENILTQNKGEGLDETGGLDFRGFTCKFNRQESGVGMHDDGSFLTFGYIDEDTLADCGTAIEDIKYTPVHPTGNLPGWFFNSGSAEVNGKLIQFPDNQAMIDTGNTFTYLQDEVCQAIYGAIPGAFQFKDLTWAFPAATAFDQLPKIILTIGSEKVLFHRGGLLTTFLAPQGDTSIVAGGIQSREAVNSTEDIWGCTFMSSIYAIFDKYNSAIGAVQRPEPRVKDVQADIVSCRNPRKRKELATPRIREDLKMVKARSRRAH